MSKKLKFFIFVAVSFLLVITSVKAATIVGNNITTTGKIGIGTTTPAASLDVNGSLKVSGLTTFLGNLVGYGNLNFQGEHATTIGTSNPQDLQLIVNGAPKMTIKSSIGGIGVLTASPKSSLDVGGNVAIGAYAGVNAAPTDGLIVSGNVGIGTAAPSEELEVIGDVIVDGSGRFKDWLTITNEKRGDGARLKVDGTYGATSTDALVEIMGTSSRLMFVSGETSWPTTWSLGINTGLEAKPNQNFQIREVSDGIGSVNLPRLTILKSSGNIGIGTTTPNTKLHLFDNSNNLALTLEGINPMLRFSDTNSIALNKNWALYAHAGTLIGAIAEDGWNNGDTPWLEVKRSGEDKISSVNFPNGNIGIGTTTPETLFQVCNGESTTTVEFGGVNSSNKGSCLKLRDSDGAGWTYCTTLKGALSCSQISCE